MLAGMRVAISLACLWLVAPGLAVADGEDAPLREPSATAAPDLQFSPNRALLLAAGHDALMARLDIVARARQRIDMQYYLYHNDRAGRLLARAMLQAADRGVKVRILLDDIHGSDDDIAEALNQHPNIDIRRFNPFRWRQLRLLETVLAFSRVNRRMHNKQLTVDGELSIVGGRNIGDEYFGTGEGSTFADLDVLVQGPAVRELVEVFDAYWDNPRSKQRYRRTAAGHAKLDALVARMAEQLRADEALLAPVLARSRYAEAQERGDALPYACPAAVLADRPEQKEVGRAESDVVDGLSRYLRDAGSDLMLVSAYFVPGKGGMKELQAARERQVVVTVLTNSLASTDVMAVHAGYSRYREVLLEAGIQLWEMKPEADLRERRHFSIGGSSQASLHTKAYVFDQRYLFIGSFNLDPRSAVLNTEMGLMFDCPAMVRDFRASMATLLPGMAWQVFLDKGDGLRWVDRAQAREEDLGDEPLAGFWRRAGVWWLKRLPIEGNL